MAVTSECISSTKSVTVVSFSFCNILTIWAGHQLFDVEKKLSFLMHWYNLRMVEKCFFACYVWERRVYV